MSNGLTLGGVGRLAPARFAVAGAVAILAATCALALPIAVAGVIDALIAGGPAGPPLLVLTALVVLRVLTEALGGLTRSAARTTAMHRLRRHVVGDLVRGGLAEARRHPPGALLALLTHNVALAAGGLPTIIGLIVAATLSLGGLVALAVLDGGLALVFLVACGLAAFVLRDVGGFAEPHEQDLRKVADIAGRLTEALAGAATIRACATLHRELDRVLAPLPAAGAAGRRMWRLRRSVAWRTDLALGGSQTAVLVAAGIGLAHGRLTVGDVLAATGYATLALGLLGQADLLAHLSEARVAARALPGHPRPDHRRPTEPETASASASASAEGGPSGRPPGLSFRAVTVCSRLREVSFDVPGGRTLALVGAAGSGKSTALMVVGGLITPDRGKVLTDGGATVRGVGYAFAEPVLVGSTLGEALRYGRPRASPAAVAQALRVANVEHLVRRLPAGLRTPIAELAVSGGERQRLGIARALVRGGRLLVLDDATSSQDTITESAIASALARHSPRLTQLVIARRAATAARADLVAWLDRGRLRGFGPHQQLWDREPDYRALFHDGEVAR